MAFYKFLIIYYNILKKATPTRSYLPIVVFLIFKQSKNGKVDSNNFLQ